MPEYKYKAQNQDGKIVKGRSDAPDSAALQRRFHDEGLTLLEATPVVRRIALKSLKKGQLADFSRQLGTLTRAGVSLVKTLERLSRHCSKRVFPKTILPSSFAPTTLFRLLPII